MTLEINGPPAVVRGVLRTGQAIGIFLLLAAIVRIPRLVSYPWDAARMSFWEPVGATLVEADYRPFSEENPREMVFARYRYEYEGAKFEGTRVDVSNRPDLVDAIHEGMWRQLSEHLRAGTPVDCYVNPSHSDESVLYPQFHVTIFAERLGVVSAFALFGALLFWGSSARLRREKRFASAKTEHPNEPWLWRDDWARGRIGASSRGMRWIVATLAAIHLFIVLPLGFLILDEWQQPLFGWIGIVLLVIAWGMIGLTWRRFRHVGRYEQAEFQMASVPGVIGGPLAGIVHIPAKTSPDSDLQVSLECVLHVPGGEDRSSREDVLWRGGTTVDRTLSSPDPYKVAIPVHFAIPFDCQPSDPPDRAQVRWQLKVGKDTTNSDQHARFVVPVYQTAESSDHYRPDPSVMEPYEKDVTPDEVLQKTTYHVAPLPGGGEEIRFSYFQWATLMGAFIVLALCGGGIGAILYFDWHPAITILPGIFMFFVVLGLLGMLLWGCRLQFERDTVTVTSGLLGFRKTRRLSPQEVEVIESAVDLQMERKSFYSVQLRAADGQTFTLVKRLDTRQEADTLSAWLSEKLPKVNVVRPPKPAVDAGTLKVNRDR
jgi:hypothetical protein